MESWISEWNSKIRPLREGHGFKIVGAWVLPGQNRFVWILGWSGTGNFAEADGKYYSSAARKKLTPDPIRHLEDGETSMMESVLRRPSPSKMKDRKD